MAEGVGRRAVLAGLAACGAFGLGASTVSATEATEAARQPPVRPRADWAGDLPAPDLPPEAPGDVRFLLVHHTQTANGYAAEAVPKQLRGMHRFHTGTDKGWPDIAYNFLIDAYGTIWEGRTGSLAGPVRGDATGGSQGFAQLCCFIGDHTRVAPTAAAQASMSSLLAWLAGRYAIDLFAGPTITFVSRGSNRWPAGATVTTDPVAGHRDMSRSQCPGDACYPLVRGALLTGAQALVGSAAIPAPAATTRPAATTPPAAAPAQAAARPPASAESTSPPFGVIGAAVGGAAVVGVAAVVAARGRRVAEPGADQPPLDVE